MKRRKSNKTKEKKGVQKKRLGDGDNEVLAICHRPGGKSKLRGFLSVSTDYEKLTFRSMKGVEYFCWDFKQMNAYKTKDGIRVVTVRVEEQDGKKTLVPEEYKFNFTNEEAENLLSKIKKACLFIILIFVSSFVANYAIKRYDVINYIRGIKEERIKMELNLTNWRSDVVETAKKAGLMIATKEYLASGQSLTFQVYTCNRPENLKWTITSLFNKMKGVRWEDILVLQDKQHTGIDGVLRDFELKFALNEGSYETGDLVLEFEAGYARGYDFKRETAGSTDLEDARLFSQEYMKNFDQSHPLKNQFIIYANEDTCKKQGVTH